MDGIHTVVTDAIDWHKAAEVLARNGTTLDNAIGIFVSRIADDDNGPLLPMTFNQETYHVLVSEDSIGPFATAEDLINALDSGIYAKD